jgi:protoporphyrinogen/coproporphyrinogen III oxidase
LTVPRIAVIGGGITGLSAAWELSAHPGVDVVVFERSEVLGGKIRSSPFAGRPSIDEGADAFLARVPWGVQLAGELGLGDSLISPSSQSAFVAFEGRLHPIPGGLILGVPKGLSGLGRSRLLTWHGKARAALDIVLPRTSTEHDSLGTTIRRRFGAEVAERLVDPLVGGINAGDADDLSLRAAVPQLVDVATTKRSMLLGLRRAPAPSPGPIFFAPLAGMGALVTSLAAALAQRGVEFRRGVGVRPIEPHWRVNDERFDGIIVTTPAFEAADLVRLVAPQTAALLASVRYAGVVMLTLAVPAEQLVGVPDGSGYLVPKPVQRHVTAVSFGSRKWAQWSPSSGGHGTEILRVSLGRHGHEAPLDMGDDEIVTTAIDEVSRHIGTAISPVDQRITRWARAFPQYQPHHLELVGGIESQLHRLSRIHVTGAAHRGIGIPACIRQGRQAATAMLDELAGTAE